MITLIVQTDSVEKVNRLHEVAEDGDDCLTVAIRDGAVTQLPLDQ